MLRTDLPDHRRATDDELIEALRRRDPLALAEAYHRTIPAAHAVARRLLSSSTEVEAVLREVYAQLWSDPPEGAALEAWIRSRCFATAADDLRERDIAPASPSMTALLPELPRPEVRYLDAAERALSELDDPHRRVLLMAHDRGVPTEEQDVPDAAAALAAALLALAGPEPGTDSVDAQACAEVPLIGDWVLGLLPPSRSAVVAEEVAARSECTALAKALRRGRRRLEGLPPTPDMGQRVLVVVLAGAPAPVPAGTGSPAPPPSALDAGSILDEIAPPAGDGSRMLSDVDTGEIPPVPGGLAPAGSERRDPYAELAALDEVEDDGHPVTLDAADAETDDAEDEYHLPRKRSLASRLVVWLLGALFMVAGVAAGLYLGLKLLS